MQTGNRYRFLIEALVLLVLICVGLIWVAAGPLLPSMMQEFGVSRGTVSWMVSIVPVMMAAFAVPAGIISSRIGIKKVFAIGVSLQAAGLITPLMTNFPLLLLSRFLFAVGAAMTFPIAGGIVVQWFSAKELSLVNGLNMTATTFGNAVALFATVSIATAISWQAPLVIYGLFAFMVALAWLFLGKERAKTTAEPQMAQNPSPGIIAILKQKTTLLLAFSLVGPFALFMAISSWLPTYYSEVFGIPLARASSITALFTIVGIPACIFGGLLPMWVGVRKPFFVIPGILLGFSGLGCFLINNPIIIFASVSLFGVCVYIFMPSIFTLPMELPNMRPENVAVVLAVALAIGNLGGFAGPLIVGYLADLTDSYLPGLVACSILSFSLFVSGLLLPETGPKAKKKAKS